MLQRYGVTPEELRRLYIDEEKSLQQIAEPLGVSRALVGKWLRAAGIPTRTKSEASLLRASRTPMTQKQIEARRRNAAVARSGVTEDSHRKQAEAIRGRPSWNQGVPWTQEQRERYLAAFDTDETRERRASAQRGEKSWNWKGGAKPELDRRLDGWQWRKLRRECYERDGWICRDCGCKCLNSRDAKPHPKLKIQAHHVVGRRDGGLDVLENLVTLCMSCHHKRERKGD